MNEATMQRLIAEDLKEMRKGRGLLGFDMKADLLVVAAVGRSYATLLTHIESELVKLDRENEIGALLNAFAIGTAKRWPGLQTPPAEELVKRRRAYAERTGVGERTLSRYEDDAIEKLAVRLAAVFMGETYQSNIREFQKSDQSKRVPPSADFSKNSRWLRRASEGTAREAVGPPKSGQQSTQLRSARTVDLPDNIPDLVRLQHARLNRLGLEIIHLDKIPLSEMPAKLEFLRYEVDLLRTITSALVQIWKVDLEG